jgi:hypothetical protein
MTAASERDGSMRGGGGPLRVLTLLGARGLQLIVILASFFLFPPIFSAENFRNNFHWPKDAAPTLASAFMTWDAQHYLYLSGHPYERGHLSVALYPLWPWVISLGDRLLPGGPLAAALVLAAVFSAGAGAIFHRVAARRLGGPAADRALLLLMAQPAGFYFGLPYAEALFLLVALLVFELLETGRLLGAALVAWLLPLIRPPGVFIVFPVLVAVLLRRRAEGRFRPADAAIVASPLLGTAAHAALMFWSTGDPFAQMTIQGNYMGQGSVLRLVDPVTVVREFLTVGGLHAPRASLLDRAFFLAFLATLPAIFRLGPIYFAYALPMGLFTGVMQGGFACFIRYLAVVFPVFIAWGGGLSRPGASAWAPLVVAALGALQLLLMLLHVNNYWVA